MVQKVESFVCGEWIAPDAGARSIAHAITGDVIAEAGNDALDFGGMVEFAHAKGGTALREMNFHQRADMLKKLALYLNEHKETLYEVSFATGATARDHMLDVNGVLAPCLSMPPKDARNCPPPTF